jgi:hypothetical protein
MEVAKSTPMSTTQLNLRAIVTSHSIDGTFESCPRKFEFAHVWQQMPEGGSTGFAAEVGTALHEAVQAWARLALFPGRERKHVNPLALEQGYHALLRWWPWALEHVSLREGKTGIKQRSLGEALLLFEEIVSAEFWESWELVDIGGFGLSIEVPYRINHVSLGTVPIPKPDGISEFGYFATQGKIDFILRNRYTGEIRVFDLKTTVKDPKAHEAAFKWSGQGPNYSLILAQAMGWDWRQKGLSVSYVVSNFASADGSEDSAVRLYTYDYTPDQIQDGVDLKVERLERMKAYASKQHWPRRSHGCDSFGNPCMYMGICGRRDPDFIRAWFAFEGYEEVTRIYEPIWELAA